MAETNNTEQVKGQDRFTAFLGADPTFLTTAQLYREVEHLRNLLEKTIEGHLASRAEHRAAMEMRFHERELRYQQLAEDNKTVLGMAIGSMKEASTKNEVAVSKQIEQLAANFSTLANALSDKIEDVRSRVLTIESRREGQTETKKTFGDNYGYVLAAILAVAGVINIVIQLQHH